MLLRLKINFREWEDPIWNIDDSLLIDQLKTLMLIKKSPYLNNLVDIRNIVAVHLIIFQYGIDEAFIKMLKIGKWLWIQYIVELGANVHYKDEYALSRMVEEGNLDMVKFLISQGADISGRLNDILCRSVSECHLEMTRYLVENYGLTLNNSRHGFTEYHNPLYKAVSGGNPEIVRYILGKMENIHCVSRSVMELAVNLNDITIINYLLEKGMDIDHEWAFFSACSYGYLDIIKLLWGRGMDMDNIDITPLKNAVSGGYTSIISFLISKGLDIKKYEGLIECEQ